MRGLSTHRTIASLTCAMVIFQVVRVSAQPEATDPGSGRRLLLFAPAGAVLIETNINTGSRSVEQIRQEYSRDLFTQLDADQSGQLEPAEWARLPMLRPGSPPPTEESLQQFLNNKLLAPEALARYVDAQLGPTFQVVAKPPRLDQTVQLMDVLDENNDSVISIEEVIRGATALRRFDLDDDEALSVAELQPFPQSIRQAQRQLVAETQGASLVLDLAASEIHSVAVDRILAAYASGASAAPIAACGLGAASARYDENSDGLLQRDELQQWLDKAPCDVALNIRIPEVGATRVAAVFEESDRVKPVAKPSFRRWEVTLDGTELRADAINNRSMSLDSLRLAKTRFMQSDADNNDYLNEQEFSGLQFSAPFSAVDANGDAMLRLDEVEAYARTRAQLSQTRLVLTIADEVTSLYQLMDGDANNRLTSRELLSLNERLAPQDRNQNGQLDSSDFISKYRLTFSFGTPEGFGQITAMPQPMAGSSRRPASPRIGPLWFQKMDRNRDKDVSWREFLGPRTTFDKLDLNHDGLIDKNEAETATTGEAVTAADARE